MKCRDGEVVICPGNKRQLCHQQMRFDSGLGSVFRSISQQEAGNGHQLVGQLASPEFISFRFFQFQFQFAAR